MMFSKKVTLTAISLCIFGGIFAQESVQEPIGYDIITTTETVKFISLDSIKSTFVRNEKISKLDNLWIQELTATDLSEDMFADIENMNLDEEVEFELSSDLLKHRLRLLDEKSPFNIQHNPALEGVIKMMLKNRKKSIGRLMALSEYYFPLFEEKLAKYKIP